MSYAETLARTAPLYDRVKSVIPPMEWPVFADDIDAILALKRRRNAVILAHNYMTPGDLPLRRRHRRRQPGAGARGDEGGRRRDRAGRRALHGRDREDAEPGEDRADPRPARRLLAGRIDHGGRRAAAARALSRRAGGDICEYIGGGEGGVRHLLHLGQRPQGDRIARRRAGDHAARRIPGAEHRRADRGEDHHLGRPLRGARTLHRRPDPRTARREPGRDRAGASGVPARGGGRGRLSPARPPTCRPMSGGRSRRAWC